MNDNTSLQFILDYLKKIEKRQVDDEKRLENIEEGNKPEIAYVTSAIPLNSKEKLRLEAGLAKIFGTDVRIHNNISRNIIGGLKIEVGSKVIDLTIKEKLQQIRNNLLNK